MDFLLPFWYNCIGFISLLREYELTETDKNKIINTLKDLLNKSK